MSSHTSLLRQALQLSSVCRLWREAALLATPELMKLQRLWPSSELPPRYLSPLLGRLVSGCHIVLEEALLTSATAPSFLEVAQPVQLTADWCSEPTSNAVGVALASCPFLTHVECWSSPPPHSFPWHLRVLEVRIKEEDASVGQQAGTLVTSLQSLPSLKKLTLAIEAWEFDLHAEQVCFAGLPALHQLVVECEEVCGEGEFSLSALGVAEELGVEVQLHVWFGSADSHAEARESLWRALARTAPLSLLRLGSSGCG